MRPRHKASGAALCWAAQFALCSRPVYLPVAVPCVRQRLTRHHQISCRTFSCRWIASQRHSPRRIAKHLSKAGLCRWQRNFVTRFLQKNLVSICVIDYDANFIEDRKSVAIGDFWTNEHPDEPVGAHITNWHPINYADLKQYVNMLITLFFYGSEHIERQV